MGCEVFKTTPVIKGLWATWFAIDEMAPVTPADNASRSMQSYQMSLGAWPQWHGQRSARAEGLQLVLGFLMFHAKITCEKSDLESGQVDSNLAYQNKGVRVKNKRSGPAEHPEPKLCPGCALAARTVAAVLVCRYCVARAAVVNPNNLALRL